MKTTENKITVDDLRRAKEVLKVNAVPLDDRVILIPMLQVEHLMRELIDYEVLKVKYNLLLKEFSELKGGIINE